MPTNEERLNVASELRYTASHSLNGYSFQRAVEGIAFGTIGDRPWREIMTRLADLIEPEPERTCRNVADDYDGMGFVCSECTRAVPEDEYDPEIDGYCSGCGAKVVE